MKATITHNGKEYEVELTSPELEKGLVPNPWPHVGDSIYVLTGNGNGMVSQATHSPFWQPALAQGNVFRTAQDAKDEALRRESIAKRWVPKGGEQFWSWDFGNSQPGLSDYAAVCLADIYIGSAFPTEEACEEWGKKYADVFKKVLG